MKTLAALCMLVLAVPAGALPATGEGRAALFGQCQGRAAAQLSHGWLSGRHDAATEGLVRTFAELRRSVTGTAPAAILSRDALLRARAHHGRLLRERDFHTDARRRAVARAEARRALAACRALILG